MKRLYQLMKRLYQRTPLTLKMMVITILVGILVWAVLDYIQTRRVKEIFQAQLVERLGQQAIEDRLNFDLHVKAYHSLAKMILQHKVFSDYIKGQEWNPDSDALVQVNHHRRAPLWYPNRTMLRAFVRPSYTILLDPLGRVREVYQYRNRTMPASLLAPTRLLIDKSQNQSFMTNIEGTPFLVTSVSSFGSQGELEAVLMLASPIDDEFLNYSLGPLRSGRIIALLTQEEEPSIVMSNNINELPPGLPVSAFKDRYLTIGREFFDYGSSEESIKLASFIATSDAELKINSIVLKERRERAIMAFILILSFVLIMYLITRRIRGLTLRISEFSQNALGVKKRAMKKGDELYALEERFQHLEEMIENQLNRLRAIHSVDKAIAGSLDMNTTFDILLTQISIQMHIDAASILLLNKHTQILEYVGSKGFRSSALRYTKLNLGESNAGRAAKEKRTVILDLKKELDGFTKSELFIKEDFVSYFGVPLIAKGEVKGVLELFQRSSLAVDPEWLEFIETVANQAAIAIDNATLFEGLKRTNIELALAYDTTIEGWSHALDLRDKETEGHSKRVTDLTLKIARAFGIKEEELVHIRRGALLHDLGKIGIPDKILLKPNKLTEEEWKIMKNHPVIAYDMLKPIEYLRTALDIPYCHHERWDGMGYPRGLKGEEIPLAARIFAVADVWDALRSDRPYRPAWSKEKTREHIISLVGTHFDSKVTEIFLKMDL